MLIDLATVAVVYFIASRLLELLQGQPFGDPPPGSPFLVLYAAYLASCLFFPERNTLGEKLSLIAPVTQEAAPLSIWHGTMRAIFMSFLWAAWILMDTRPPHGVAMIFIIWFFWFSVFAIVWGIADIVFLFATPTNRTLTDRVLRTFVVNIPPLQPHRAPAGPMYSATDAELGVLPQPPRARE